MAKAPEFFLDFLGQEVRPGDYVVGPAGKTVLGFYIVKALTPKQLTLQPAAGKCSAQSKRYLPSKICVKLDTKLVTAKLMGMV